MRPGLDAYFMGLAHAAKDRSTCERAMVGAVLVHDGIVVGMGYNGSPRGAPHCGDVGCMTDEAGHCRLAVHAELNAILNSTGRGDTMYCTHKPCLSCLKSMINFGVLRIVYDDDYVDDSRDQFMWLCAAKGWSPPSIEKIRR